MNWVFLKDEGVFQIDKGIKSKEQHEQNWRDLADYSLIKRDQ